MMIRRLLLLFSFVLCAIPMLAQDIDVADFYLDEKDLTANLQGTMVIDQNGEKCALIKVKTTETGFGFDVGSLGVTKTEQKIAEIWVYVPFGVKRMTLSHQQFGQVEYYFPTRIEKARTYIMKLTTAQVERVEYDYDHTEAMRLKVTPPDATVYVDGRKYKPNADGVLTLDEQAYGRHPVKVTAEHYDEQKTYVVVDDTSKDRVETINLEPRFGWLKVNDNDPSLKVYADGELQPISADGRVILDAGSYDIRVKKDLYKPVDVSLQIKKQEEYELKPNYIADFANMTFSVGNNAEIFLNGKSYGKGQWSGPVESGTYDVECRLDKHYTTHKQVTVRLNENNSISLETPSPILGKLNVVTSPVGATLMLDGENVGVTPYTGNIIIGEHTLNVSAPNHGRLSQTVTIKEGETNNVDLTMPSADSFTFTSNPSGADILINGQKVGVTPYTAEMNCGDYDVTITKKNYKEISKRIHLDSSKTTNSFHLNNKYNGHTNFYVQPTFQVLSSMAVGASVGAYVSNVNVEATFMKGMTESDGVYWTNISDITKYPTIAWYKATYMGVRAGYGISVGNRLRVTPQVGAKVVNFSACRTDNYAGTSIPLDNYYADKFYAFDAEAAVKMEFAIIDHVAISVVPDYSIAVKKSQNYEACEEIAGLKKLSEGFNLRVGVNVFF